MNKTDYYLSLVTNSLKRKGEILGFLCILKMALPGIPLKEVSNEKIINDTLHSGWTVYK